MKRKKWFVYAAGVALVALAGLSGCIYSSSFESGDERYVVLYGYDKWQQDTGWDEARLKITGVPIWNTLDSYERQQVSALPIGCMAKIVDETKHGYQVVNPNDQSIGWLNKIYVKEVVLKPILPNEPLVNEQIASVARPQSLQAQREVKVVSMPLGGAAPTAPATGQPIKNRRVY